MSVSTTPLLGDTAPGRTWPSIGCEYYTPILRLVLWHTGGPGSSLSDIRRISLEGKGRRTQDETRVTCHAREKTTGIEPHPAHVFPTAERLRRQCPLPSRGDGLFSEQGGAWHRRRVVYQISPAKNPSSRSGGAHEEWRSPRTWWSTCWEA